MSKAMKFNIVQVISWSIIALCMIIIFSMKGTIENWGDNKIKTILLALLFLLGYGGNMLLMILEKSSKWGFKRDERDQLIQYQSLSRAILILILYIYTVSIILYIKYETARFVPIGWVWFIAYSSVVVTFISSGYTSLYLYRKQGN